MLFRSGPCSPTPDQPHQSPGLFSWARECTKSKPPESFSTLSSVLSTGDSSLLNPTSYWRVRTDICHFLKKFPQIFVNSLPAKGRRVWRGDNVGSNKNAAVLPIPSPRPDYPTLDTSSHDSEREEDEEVDTDGEPGPPPRSETDNNTSR